MTPRPCPHTPCLMLPSRLLELRPLRRQEVGREEFLRRVRRSVTLCCISHGCDRPKCHENRFSTGSKTFYETQGCCATDYRLTRFTREAWHDFLPVYLAMLKLEDSLANADTTVSPRCAIKELICTSVENTALQCHWQTYRHPGSARAIRSLLQRNQGPLCISSPTRHLKRACTSCKLFTA